MTTWFKRFPVLLALSLFGSLYGAGAFAIDLQTAKAQGLIGEMNSGYLGAPKPPSAEVSSLISDINNKRKIQYQKVAQKVGKPLKAIEKLAGEKALAKTSVGNYIQAPQGGWIKKQ